LEKKVNDSEGKIGDGETRKGETSPLQNRLEPVHEREVSASDIQLIWPLARVGCFEKLGDHAFLNRARIPYFNQPSCR
jgi:hypothetical protein